MLHAVHRSVASFGLLAMLLVSASCSGGSAVETSITVPETSITSAPETTPSSVAPGPDTSVPDEGSGGIAELPEPVDVYPGERYALRVGVVQRTLPVREVAWDPTGRWVALASSVGAHVYDREAFTAAPAVLTMIGEADVVAFSPSGFQIVVGNDASLHVWQVGSWEHRVGWVLPTSEVAWLTEDRLVVYGRTGVRLFDLATGESLWEWSLQEPPTASSDRFAADAAAGTLVVGEDDSITVLDAITGEVIAGVGDLDGLMNLDSGGDIVAANVASSLRLWSLPEMEPLAEAELEEAFGYVTVSDESVRLLGRLWLEWPLAAATSGVPPTVQADPDVLVDGLIGADGVIAFGDRGGLRVATVGEGGEFTVDWEYDEDTWMRVASPEGRALLLVGFDHIALVDTSSWDVVTTDDGPIPARQIGAVSVAPGGRYLAVSPAEYFGELRLVETETGSVEQLRSSQDLFSDWYGTFDSGGGLLLFNATEVERAAEAGFGVPPDRWATAWSNALPYAISAELLAISDQNFMESNCYSVVELDTLQPVGEVAIGPSPPLFTSDAAILVVARRAFVAGYRTEDLTVEEGPGCASAPVTWTYDIEDDASLVGMTADDRLLLMQSTSRLITVDARSGDELASVAIDGPYSSAVLHPAGDLAVFSRQGRAAVVDVASGDVLGTLPFSGRLFFDPTGTYLVAADRGELHLIEWASVAP